MTDFIGTKSQNTFTKEELRHFGEEAFAYIRELTQEDFEVIYPGMLDGDVPW